jgi:hypothetical protein
MKLQEAVAQALALWLMPGGGASMIAGTISGNGHTPPKRPGGKLASEYEIPLDWEDEKGESRRVNLERYGDEDDHEYWPPAPLI